jgi:predicted 3-demethylubiquinone-9 3-methyltransferase (glyoxalase superfamily)
MDTNKQPIITSTQKITPFLWFDNQAEEAMNFYNSIFKNSKIGHVARYGTAGPGEKGQVMTASFTLNGVDFIALNGGPQFKFTPAVSFFVHCETQQEVDYLWDALIADGGKPSQCAWLTDKYGVSWQIVPNLLSQLLGDPDREKAGRVMKAMLQMTKIDTVKLKQAYDGA